MRLNNTENTDEALWSSFLDGDNNSLEKIYRYYFDELYNYGNRWLKNTELTEDSIQDLFIKLLGNRNNLSATTSVKYYLFRSFRSIVLDKVRVKKRVQFIDDPGEHLFLLELSPENKLIDKQEYESLKLKLSAAMVALTPRQREAIFLRYTEGFSYPEVAEMMSLTPKATYKLMARAIDALKTQMNITTLILASQIFFEMMG